MAAPHPKTTLTRTTMARRTTPRVDLAFPYRIDVDGGTAVLRSPLTSHETPGGDRHLRDLIEQLLFTSPGERVMRPDFGSGLARLVFEPSGEALAVALQAQMQAVILMHLGDRLELDDLAVEADGGSLRITVAYRPLVDGRRRVETFEREI
jgi:Bacteriophage baseplate protein W